MPSEQGMPPSNNLLSPTTSSWCCDYCGIGGFRSYDEAVMHESECSDRASADAAARKRRRPGSSPQTHGGYAPVAEDRHEPHPHRQPNDEFLSPAPTHRPMSHSDQALNSLSTPMHPHPHQLHYGHQPSPHYHEPSPMIPSSHHQLRSSPSPSPPDPTGGQHARSWDNTGGDTGGHGPPAPSPPPVATPGAVATTPQHYMPLMMSHTPLARSSASGAPRLPPMVLLPLPEAHRYRSARDLTEHDSVACQNVEVFRATIEDVADHSSSSPERGGRAGESDGKSGTGGSSIVVGQVGLRCIHCSRSPLASAVYNTVFPGSIGSMGASIRMMSQRHFPACGMTPQDVREVMVRAAEVESERRRRKQRERSGGSRKGQNDGEDDDDDSASGDREALHHFCVEFCRKENVVNRFPGKTGLVFGSHSHEDHLPGSSPVSSTMKQEAITPRDPMRYAHPAPSPLRSHPSMSETSMMVQPTPLASKKRQGERSSLDIMKQEKEEPIPQPSPTYASGPPPGQSQSGGGNIPGPGHIESGFPPYPQSHRTSSPGPGPMMMQSQGPMYGQGGGPPPHNPNGSPPVEMDPGFAGGPGGPPHQQQGPAPQYDPSPSSPNFPFYQDGYGAWLCRYCVSLPPHFKNPSCVWNHPSQSPPASAYIEQHLRSCQGYNQPQHMPSHHPGAGPPMYHQQGHMYGPPHQQPLPPHQYPTHPHGPHQGQPPPNYPPGQQPPPPGPHGGPPHWGSPPNPAGGPPPHPGMMQHPQGQPPPHGGHPSPPYPPPHDHPQHGGGGGPPPYPPYQQPHPPPHGMPHQPPPMHMQGPGSPRERNGSPSRQGGQQPMFPEGSDAAVQSAIDYLTNAEREYKSALSSSGAKPNESWEDLVLGEDKLLLTDYFFHLMKQLRLCRFSESDRKTRGGKRENIAIGYGGLQCIHCSDTPNSRKFFWSNVDRLANSFAEIPGHVLKCRRCPSQTKAAISELKRRHPDQMARLPRGSQKVFFRRMWRRLHDGDSDAAAASAGTNTAAAVPSSSSPAAPSKSPSGEKEVKKEGDSPGAGAGVLHTPIASRSSRAAGSKISGEASIAISTPVTSTSAREVGGVLSATTTDGAARALAASASGVSPPEPVLLAIDEDKEWLSDMDCFVRLNVEAFCATEEDVAAAASDRKYPITRGQVGIRCLHCATSNSGEGARGTAVSFPYSISGIYESVREFQRVHLESCDNLPVDIRDKLNKLTSLKSSTSLSSVLRRYYVLAAKALGMYDTSDGIRAGGETVPVDASGYEFSSGRSTTPAIKQEAPTSNVHSGVSPFEAGGPSVTPLESRKRKASSPTAEEVSAKKCSLDLNRDI